MTFLKNFVKIFKLKYKYQTLDFTKEWDYCILSSLELGRGH